METFNIKPCYEVGQLKNSIKEAILEGEIKNDYDEAYSYMMNKAIEFGLKSGLGMLEELMKSDFEIKKSVKNIRRKVWHALEDFELIKDGDKVMVLFVWGKRQLYHARYTFIYSVHEENRF